MSVIWLMDMCDMTRSWLVRRKTVEDHSMVCSYVWRDAFTRVTWLIHICDMSDSRLIEWKTAEHHSAVWYVNICDMTHSSVWHGSFVTHQVEDCGRSQHGVATGPPIALVTDAQVYTSMYMSQLYIEALLVYHHRVGVWCTGVYVCIRVCMCTTLWIQYDHSSLPCTCLYMYLYIYTFMHWYIDRIKSSLWSLMHRCTCVCMCMHVYVDTLWM